jgi:outer membrane protein
MKLAGYLWVLTLFLIIPGVGNAQQTEIWDLEKCILHALDNNLSIKRSELGVRHREVNLTESRYSMLPSLNTGGQGGYRWGRSIDPTSNQFVTRRITSMGVSGSSGVTLYSGSQIRNSISRDKVNLEASYYDLEDSRNNVTLNVISFYLDVVFFQELVKNSERKLEVTEAQLQQTIRLVEAGAAPLSNQLELEAQKASIEVENIRASNELDMAILRLKQLLLLPAGQEFTIQVPEISVEDISMAGYSALEVYEIAAQTQPVMKSADLRVQSSDIGVRIARGGQSPILSLSANVFTNYSNAAQGRAIEGEVFEIERTIGHLKDDPTQKVVTILQIPMTDPNYTPFEQFGDNLSKSLTLNLSVPIFNNYRVKSNIQRASIARDEAIISRREVNQQLIQAIERAYNDALAASKTYYASLKQVDALEESYRSVERRYNLGAVNFVSYQVAQNNLFNARYELLRSKYDYLFRIKVLDFYMGNPLSL